MATNPLPENLLDDRLPDWWRGLAIDLDGERLALRRQTIDELAEGLTSSQAPAAVAYAHGVVEAGAPLIDSIRATARASDSTFAGDVDDAEPAALVAAALAHKLSTAPREELSTLVSGLVLCAAWRGLRSVIEGQRLSDYAALQYEYAGAQTRVGPSMLVRPLARKTVADLLENLPEIPATGAAVTDSDVSQHMLAHAETLKKLAIRVDTIAERAMKEQSVLREQLGQQVWLLEEWCRLADKPWRDLPASAVPVIAAAELDSCTTLTGPLPSATVLLASTIVKSGHDPTALLAPLGCLEAANAIAPVDLDRAPVGEVLPLSAANGALRSGGTSQAMRKLGRSFLPTGKQPSLSIAEEAYRELRMLRIVRA